ncbi:MAG: replication restart helicase PriA, partial [Bacillota bacterium]
MIASVIVDIEHQAVDQTYDYTIPKHLQPHIEPGQRVIVSFGPRKLAAIVISLKATSPIQTLKPIYSLYDIEPIFSKEHIELAHYLSFKHATPMIKYLNLMLPNAMRMTYKKVLRLNNRSRLPASLKSLFKTKDTIPFDHTLIDHIQTIKTAINNHSLTLDTITKQKQNRYTETIIYLKTEKPVRGKKQQAVIDYLKTHHYKEKKTLIEQTKSAPATIKSLIDKGIIATASIDKYKELKTLKSVKDKPIHLTNPQTHVIDTVYKHFESATPFLLHGVTSSGKTEVYIALAKKVLAQQKSVIMLVPEISLTPSLTARFKAVFGDQVAVYHSRLNLGEQYNEWLKIKDQKASILIGARSAIFAPISNLGLIIMDEEHSTSYIQDDTPKYDAYDVASKRMIYHSVPLLLGSATPSVTRYYQATQGDITLLTLKDRVLDSNLPDIHLVDMKKEFLQGNKTLFSKPLIHAMQTRLKNHEQTLLLINRRGHANFVLCRNCGKTITCDQCDLSMTYHKQDNSLKCHYCNESKPMPSECPSCHSPHIRYMGIGTERVEQDLKALFKNANIYRMDKDTTTQKHGHETVLNAFESDGDFLVGTQMISKGLDFENVTLVAVLSADMSLFVPDYYAQEETFSLLSQMAGRAGRRHIKGDVIIQAYDYDHAVLKDVKNHQYETFYKKEITMRKTLNLPPFKRMLAV